jgi:ribosomal protein S12 methylthiotransferase
MKKYHIESLGCAKNQVDSELLMARLQSSGWLPSECEDADAVIVNSCGFIESAKQESINTVLEFRKQFPAKKIILAGCLAVRYENELRESLTEADLICPSSNAEHIAALIDQYDMGDPRRGALRGHSPAEGVAEKQRFGARGRLPPPISNEGARPLLSLPGQAYIKIAEGCNNRCAFCAIPLIRGPLQSRTIEAVKSEFETLLGRGVKEVCLIAQDSAAFGTDIEGACLLPALLGSLLTVKGDYWIRLLYLHPDHFPFDILPLAQSDSRLLPYFDIPFQHAAKKILTAMGRCGDKEIYLSLIDKIRSTLPDAVLRATFLTGFPGETDGDFEELLDFQAKAALDWAGVFTYSAEDGTPAAALKKRPSKKSAAARKKKIEEAQIPISSSRLLRYSNKRLTVLVEEEIHGEAGLYLGRASLNAPEVDGAVVVESDKKLTPGGFASGVIIGCAGFDLRMSAD